MEKPVQARQQQGRRHGNNGCQRIGVTYNNNHHKLGSEPRRWDDIDDAGDHHHHGHRNSRLNGARSVAHEPVYRERERSPRHSQGDYYRGRHRETIFKPKAATTQNASNMMFNLRNSRQCTTTPRSPAQFFTGVAESLGDDAWFNHNSGRRYKVPTTAPHHLVPVHRAYYRIKSVLPATLSPSVQEVDSALSQFLHKVDDIAAQVSDQHQRGQEGLEEEIVHLKQSLHKPPSANCEPGGKSTPEPTQARPSTPTHSPEPTSGIANCLDTAAPTMAEGRLEPSVDDLFCTPIPPILPQKPPRVQRQKRTFDMTAVRRSARLANRHGPALQRAQKNLLRKLGLQGEEATSIEAVLRDYVKSIQGPLPDYIIGAMIALLDLDDENANQMTDAPLQHVGDGINDLQVEQDGLMEQRV
ncbi:unnamed protein product [Urochloa humidicola]